MQKFTIYHPNHKNTGSALCLTPFIADMQNSGHLILDFVLQSSVAEWEDGKAVFPTFDWANRVIVRLDPMDVMEIIRVFKGEQESINDGMGIFGKHSGGNCILDVRHSIEPVPSYTFILKMRNDGEKTRRVSLSGNEAEAVCAALSYAIGPMMFGKIG